MRFANLSVATATLITGAALVAPGNASAADVDRYVQQHRPPQQYRPPVHVVPQQQYRPPVHVVPQAQYRPPVHYVNPRPPVYAQRPVYPYVVGGGAVVGGGYYYGNAPTYYGNAPTYYGETYVPVQPGYNDDAVSYCIQTYGAAFDINTMTYLANDGGRYPCP